MAARVQLALAAALAMVAVVLGIVLLTGGGDASGRFKINPTGYAGAVRPPGIPPKPLVLDDQDGRRVDLSQYRGKVVILTFLYTTCKDTCPVTASTIRGALDDLGSRAVPALAVSVDPKNDNTDRAKQFLLRESLTRRMQFLLGSRAQLAPVWRDYGVQPQLGGTSQAAQHSVSVVLLDQAGRQRIGFDYDTLTPEGIAHDVRKLQDEA